MTFDTALSLIQFVPALYFNSRALDRTQPHADRLVYCALGCSFFLGAVLG